MCLSSLTDHGSPQGCASEVGLGVGQGDVEAQRDVEPAPDPEPVVALEHLVEPLIVPVDEEERQLRAVADEAVLRACWHSRGVRGRLRSCHNEGQLEA